VSILFNDKTVNVKSLLNLLGAGIRQGSRILLVVEGEDEQQTLADMVQLIEQLPE
jgi:phosphotransferase system HPr (HPr) family protein